MVKGGFRFGRKFVDSLPFGCLSPGCPDRHGLIIIQVGYVLAIHYALRKYPYAHMSYLCICSFAGYLMRGMAYFPIAGTLIGIFVSTFYDLASLTLSLPFTIASIISEVTSLWITGCFHEDGLADSADGIGGGWTSEQILKIMTDTRLGTYGCAILLLYMIAKVELIATLGSSTWCVGNCEGGGPAVIAT